MKANQIDEQAVEEMREKIRQEISKAVEGGLVTWTEFADWLTQALYNAGYRKQSEVIDEFVKRLKDAPIRCAYPLFGLSTKAEIEIHFNDIMLQVGDAIDSIAKEMKGGE